MRRREFIAGLGSAAAWPGGGAGAATEDASDRGENCHGIWAQDNCRHPLVSAMFWTGASRAQDADANAGRDRKAALAQQRIRRGQAAASPESPDVPALATRSPGPTIVAMADLVDKAIRAVRPSPFGSGQHTAVQVPPTSI
jgi:hypothetical protein